MNLLRNTWLTVTVLGWAGLTACSGGELGADSGGATGGALSAAGGSQSAAGGQVGVGGVAAGGSLTPAGGAPPGAGGVGLPGTGGFGQGVGGFSFPGTGGSSFPGTGGGDQGTGGAVGPGAGGSDAGTGGGSATVTFAEVGQSIQEACGAVACHGGKERPTLTFDAANPNTLYNTLTTSGVFQCGNDKLVTPGDAANSTLIEVLSGCGNLRMPEDCNAQCQTALTDTVALWEAWIEAGANNP